MTLLRHVCWTISNLCTGEPSPPLQDLIPIFPFLLEQLANEDREILSDICSALSNSLFDEDSDRIQAVLDAGLLSGLINVLTRRPPRTRRQAVFTNEEPQLAALGVIVKILSGQNENQTQLVLDSGILPIFSSFFRHATEEIKTRTCEALSNIITSATSAQLEMVIDSALLSQLMKLASAASSSASPSLVLAKEYHRCLSYSTEKRDLTLTQSLTENGLFSYLAQSLTSSDPETLHLALLMIDDLLNTDRSFHEPVAGQLGSLLKELSVSPYSDLAMRLEKIQLRLRLDEDLSTEEAGH
jgi:hypothetical protein